MESLLRFILVTWIGYVESSPPAPVKMERKEKDVTYGYSQCLNFPRTSSTGWWSKCTCKKEYSTIMSEENKEYNCLTPQEVGCDYNVHESSDQTFLITKSNVTKVLRPPVNARNVAIRRILVWHYDGWYGHWKDFTTVGSQYFDIDDTEITTLKKSKLDIRIWSGHVVKVEFGEEKGMCAVVKIKGTISYPFNETAFAIALNTTTPPPTTHPPTTIATTKRTTTRRVTTEYKTKPTTIHTTPGIVTKSPVIQENKHKNVYIAIGVTGVVVLAVIVFVFMYRRKRSNKEEDYSKNVEENTLDNIYTNISYNSYEPENNKKDMFIEPNIQGSSEPRSIENPGYMCYVESDDSVKSENIKYSPQLNNEKINEQ